MSRPWVAPLARTGVVALAAAGLVLGAGALGETSAPGATSSPEPSTPTRPATDATLICPGAPLEGIGDIASTPVRSSLLARSGPGRLVRELVTPPTEKGELTLTPFSAASPAATTTNAIAKTRWADADPMLVRGRQAHAPALVATQELTVGTDEVRGLATTACGPAHPDAWFVAGGGQDGRQERLLLSNPGANPVTVTIRGLDAPTQEQRVVVPQQGRTAVLLDGITGTDAPQVVRVTATGGQVHAVLVDSWREGLQPKGLEVVGPTAPPAREQVLPGGLDSASRSLVVAMPGSRDAVVTIREVTDDGLRPVEVVTVPAAGALTVPLKPTKGTRGYRVSADEPVVAAAQWRAVATGGGSDLAWAVATRPVTALVGTALPDPPAATTARRLHLVAPGEKSEVAVTTVTDGQERTEPVVVPAGSAAVVEVTDAQAVWVRRTGGGELHAGLVTDGTSSRSDRLVAGSLLTPARVSARSVEVVGVP